MAAVLRQLVCDLCGDSGGAQQLCFLCGVSPYGAASGNRQRRQHREIVALMPPLLLSVFLFHFSSKQACSETFEHWSAMPWLHSCTVYLQSADSSSLPCVLPLERCATATCEQACKQERGTCPPLMMAAVYICRRAMRTAPACSTLQVRCWRIHRFVVYLQRTKEKEESALDQQNITNPKHYNEYFESDASVSMLTVTVLLPRI